MLPSYAEVCNNLHVQIFNLILLEMEKSGEKKAFNLMEVKGVFFYPVIVVCTCWTALNFSRIFTYVDVLKTDFPNCTVSNPNRLAIIIATVVATFIGKVPLETISRVLWSKYLTQKKFPRGSELRETKVDMLAERVFKTLLILFCVVSLYVIMSRLDCNFLDKRIGGLYDRPLYFENYPCQKIPDYLDNFYMFRLTYHLIELLYTPIK